MHEHQNIEYKSSWRDEHLRWLCVFANAQGGTLDIGKDDKGNIVCVKNVAKLMEDLHNKITSIFGIVANVLQFNKKFYVYRTVTAISNRKN